MIPAGNKKLAAELTIPAGAHAIVIFARSGADAHLNRRDGAVAAQLQKAGFGTLLPDLLTQGEALAPKEFDIDLLTARLLIVTRWVRERDLFGHYRLAFFAFSVAAAAAIQASVCIDEDLDAIVCCSGRTDLATEALPELQAPTLLIAGSLDRPVLEFNRQALAMLSCPKQLQVVQGTTHLFSGEKLDEVASHATHWFHLHLTNVNHQTNTI